MTHPQHFLHQTPTQHSVLFSLAKLAQGFEPSTDQEQPCGVPAVRGSAATQALGTDHCSTGMAPDEAKKAESAAAASAKKKDEPPKPVDPVTHGMNGNFLLWIFMHSAWFK